MLPNDIYHAQLLVARDGGVYRHPAGRFMIKDGVLHHLEDYHGELGRVIPEGVVDDLTVDKINRCGPHLSIASHHDIVNGHRLDFVPEHPLPAMLPDPQVQAAQPAQAASMPPLPKFAPVFHYHRAGHDRPHTVEVKGGKYMLDGNPLEHDEVQAILDNVRTGAARLRYAQTGALAKAEPYEVQEEKGKQLDPQEALARLDQLGSGNEKVTEALAALRRHIFEDPMTGLGNKYAYQEFRKKNVPGVTVVGDANFFKGINDVYGHEAGDSAIKALGSAWKAAVESTGEGKAHRFGGDEFHAHFPTYEHAARFARSLRHNLQQVPPVSGTHRLSMSLGVGDNFEAADKALYSAKAQKAGHTPTTIQPILAHSLHPQSPGMVPTDPSELALVRPPAAPASTVPENEGRSHHESV